MVNTRVDLRPEFKPQENFSASHYGGCHDGVGHAAECAILLTTGLLDTHRQDEDHTTDFFWMGSAG